MTKAGIAELKARLSKYLEQVKTGQEVLITEHGRPIAKIVPLEGKVAEGRRERLIRAGLLRPGKGRLRAVLLKAPEGDPRIGAEVLKALLEEREEGR